MKVYLAGPLFTIPERLHNSLLAQAFQSKRIDFFLPQHECRELKDAKEIAFKCLNGIGVCSHILANLDGPDVDSGTAFELGFAYSLGKTVIGYRTDFRSSAETEFGVNAMFTTCTQLIQIRDPATFVPTLLEALGVGRIAIPN